MTNQKAAADALHALDENAAMRPKDNINELHIKIVRCSDLKSRRPSKLTLVEKSHFNIPYINLYSFGYKKNKLFI